MSEPIFKNIHCNDEQIELAHTRAAETITEFQGLLEDRTGATYK